ncbi:acyl-CoA thioesterase [Halocatena marina]|uniref:Acyl-CoA thioesterase n=1 Tax=Halocatena marina TaxID=2934937 RepID=A0ABD5YMB1_9EURY|nr:thioesterase family protein [Halocatena marina]
MSQEPFTTDIPVRYRDLDTQNHVNNAVYGTYLEQARAAYIADVLGEAIDQCAVVLAHISIDFRTPVTLADESVSVTVRVPDLGTSSIPMEYEIRTGDGVAATAESVTVAVDEDGGPRSLPEEWRDQVTTYESLSQN